MGAIKDCFPLAPLPGGHTNQAVRSSRRLFVLSLCRPNIYRYPSVLGDAVGNRISPKGATRDEARVARQCLGKQGMRIISVSRPQRIEGEGEGGREGRGGTSSVAVIYVNILSKLFITIVGILPKGSGQ